MSSIGMWTAKLKDGHCEAHSYVMCSHRTPIRITLMSRVPLTVTIKSNTKENFMLLTDMKKLSRVVLK